MCLCEQISQKDRMMFEDVEQEYICQEYSISGEILPPLFVQWLSAQQTFTVLEEVLTK